MEAAGEWGETAPVRDRKRVRYDLYWAGSFGPVLLRKQRRLISFLPSHSAAVMVSKRIVCDMKVCAKRSPSVT